MVIDSSARRESRASRQIRPEVVPSRFVGQRTASSSALDAKTEAGSRWNDTVAE